MAGAVVVVLHAGVEGQVGGREEEQPGDPPQRRRPRLGPFEAEDCVVCVYVRFGEGFNDNWGQEARRWRNTASASQKGKPPPTSRAPRSPSPAPPRVAASTTVPGGASRLSASRQARPAGWDAPITRMMTWSRWSSSGGGCFRGGGGGPGGAASSLRRRAGVDIAAMAAIACAPNVPLLRSSRQCGRWLAPAGAVPQRIPRSGVAPGAERLA